MVSLKELHKIKRIHAKSSKKYDSSISNISIIDGSD